VRPRDRDQAPLAISLLGGLSIRRHGRPADVDFQTAKARALLAYLLLNHDTYHPRAILADMFWPESDADRARNTLRATLKFIRDEIQTWGVDRYAVIPDDSRNQIRLVLPSDWWVDVLELRRLLQESGARPFGSPEWLETRSAAGELCLGELLPEATAEYFREERDRLRQACSECFHDLTRAEERRGEIDRAVRWSVRSVAFDKLDETSHRDLMRLYLRLGMPARGDAQYKLLRNILHEELNTVPSPETVDLWRLIVAQLTHPAAPPLPVEPVPAVDIDEAPRVGRDTEWDRMRQAWEQARAGRGGVLLVWGEAGIGKSRLCGELTQRAALDGGLALIGRAHANESHHPYGPVRAAVQRGIELAREGGLTLCEGIWLRQVARIVPEITEPGFDAVATPHEGAGVTESAGGAPTVDRVQPDDTGGGADRLFQGLTQFFLALARQRPVCLFFDDLHWADPGTGEFVRYLSHRVEGTNLLLVGAYRQTDVPSGSWLNAWKTEMGARGPLVSVLLDCLTMEQVVELLARLATMSESSAFLQELGRRLHALTEGNPFFVLAVIKLLFEQRYLEMDDEGRWRLRSERFMEEDARNGNGARGRSLFERLPVPTTVQALIGQRVDQLGAEDRRLLEYAAVIGRQFRFLDLQRVAGDIPDAFSAMERLIQADMLRSHPESGNYDFFHNLVREVVYRSLSELRRQDLHWRVAEVLESLYNVSTAAVQMEPAYPTNWLPRPAVPMERARAEAHAPELARHYCEAAPLHGAEKAIAYSYLAGCGGRALTAYEEARAHLTTALELLLQAPLDEPALRLWGQIAEHLAFVYRSCNQSSQAVTTLRDYIETCEEEGYGRGLAHGYTVLAIFKSMNPSVEVGDTGGALLERALAVCEAEGLTEFLPVARAYLATALVDTGPAGLDRAEQLTRAGLAHPEIRSQPRVWGRCYNVLIHAATLRGAWGEIPRLFGELLSGGEIGDITLRFLLEGIEEACRQQGEPALFVSLADAMLAEYRRAGRQPPVRRWYLAPATAPPVAGELWRQEGFDGPELPAGFVWRDPTRGSRIDWRTQPGELRIIPAPGADLWPNANFDAPRLLLAVSGDYAVEVDVELVQEQMLAGLLIWIDDRNFVKLEMRGRSPERVNMELEARIDGNFETICVGPADRRPMRLRLERTGTSVRGLCSPDGRAWWELGTTWLPRRHEDSVTAAREYAGLTAHSPFPGDCARYRRMCLRRIGRGGNRAPDR
jgi:DNA-binding SARP family transcriptional activator